MISLRPYQRAAIDSLYAYFASNDGNPLIVLPTGAGKSVVIAVFIREVMERWPNQRVLMLTHVKELIEQNFLRLTDVWPDAPVGIYSASLRRRDVYDPVLFAGIQSVHRKAQILGRFDLVLVDECHLIGHASDGMYRRLLDDLVAMNPALKVIGLTATAFRTGTGDITYGESAIFTDIAYELPLKQLLDAGHLAPLISKRTEVDLDVSGVTIRQGEFAQGELEAAVDKDDVTQAAVKEIVEYGTGRRSWLVFCSGVRHAEHVRDALSDRGIRVACVTGDTPKTEREQIIADYKAGALQAVTNANVLTTGFDAPETDLIAFLRPTCSPGLYVQMAGRGMRTASGKDNCLVLDFAGNVARHGPVDQVQPWRPSKRKKKDGAAPVRVCPDCKTIVGVQVPKCPDCGFEWPVDPQHAATAACLPILSEPKERVIETLDVDGVSYALHQKRGKLPSMRVNYLCGLRTFSEWVCVEHTGYPRAKAVSWWWQRAPGDEIPTTVESALVAAEALPEPTRITVDLTDKYPEILNHEFEPNASTHATPKAAGVGRFADRDPMFGSDADDYALF